MSERFYVNCRLAPGPLVLQGPEAHHLAVVCRLRPGDAACLFNGDGREYRATISRVERRQVEVVIIDSNASVRELPFRLHIACPLPKGDRGQFLIEKLTELGCTAFTPLRTQRSVVHPGEGKAEKLQRHVIEACKQCGRNVLMRIDELTPWDRFVRQPDLPEQRLLAHFDGEPVGTATTGGDVMAAVGPEGGFTAEEVELARGAGWRVVDLGPRVLRVETAALALAAWTALRHAASDS